MSIKGYNLKQLNKMTCNKPGHKNSAFLFYIENDNFACKYCVPEKNAPGKAWKCLSNYARDTIKPAVDNKIAKYATNKSSINDLQKILNTLVSKYKRRIEIIRAFIRTLNDVNPTDNVMEQYKTQVDNALRNDKDNELASVSSAFGATVRDEVDGDNWGATAITEKCKGLNTKIDEEEKIIEEVENYVKGLKNFKTEVNNLTASSIVENKIDRSLLDRWVGKR